MWNKQVGLTNFQLRESPVTFQDLLYAVQLGLVPGYSIAQKSGRNPNVTSGSIPEDMWHGSTIYSGFPTTAPEVLEFFSSDPADAGTVTYFYLATSASTSWQSAQIQLNGTTSVFGVSAYRVHTGSYIASTSTGFNIGQITCRHSITTANVFFILPAGRSQTYDAVYTIPAQNTGYLFSQFATINTVVSCVGETALWVRNINSSPRLRRNMSLSNVYRTEDLSLISAPLVLSAGTDITMRILTASSASTQTYLGGFDILLEQNF